MGDFGNEMSWSHSKVLTHRECPRKFWLGRYGFWDAWKYGSADEETQLADVLKNMGNRFSWPGDVVHDKAEALIRSGKTEDYDAMVKASLGLMAKDVRASKETWWRFDSAKLSSYKSFRKSFGLEEHFYGIPPEQWFGPMPSQTVRTCLAGLLESPTFKSVVSALHRPFGDEEILNLEELESYQIEGVKAYVKTDVTWRRADGVIEIDDWKTGKPKKEHMEQLAGYAVWACEKFHVEPEDIEVKLCYLKTGEEKAKRFTVKDLDDFQENAANEIAELKLLHDPDKKRKEEFPMLPEGSKKCDRCVYRRVCGRG